MGNSSTKESRGPGRSRPSSLRNGSASDASAPQPNSTDRLVQGIYGSRVGRTGSRPDLSFLHLGSSDRELPQSEQRRETKQEREARKLEKEKIAREKARERSLKEESVDGGYLVTLGVYTGPEDYNKAIVRQLQIERRLAPFWKGLNDHKDSWTEHQLVAAARGLPIPAPDEIPLAMERTSSQMSMEARPSDAKVQGLTVPITSRSQSYQSDGSVNLSSSQPTASAAALLSASSPTGGTSLPLFRGRAKTLASLTTSSRSNSNAQLLPQETQLPKDPNVNGQPVEAYLYKDASECPICFMYYPPYLNKTRCCDQPICSECFVQIKRPEPHPPEHHDDSANAPAEPKPPEEEGLLVSEPSQCPFCVTPEFGVIYEPPPFRRGLAYVGATPSHPLASAASAMSSSSSLGSIGSRRRTHSLSATAPSVITTDRIRPDWAKKLSDARAHALRRSAAATALHNAAYVLGNQGLEGRGLVLGRRRRTLFGDSPGASGSGTPRIPEGVNLSTLLGQADRQGQGDGDVFPGRSSSRRNRVDDLEELMMMEAIRLSLAAEEDRKRKEEKDAKKDEKKKAKEAAKEAKKADKEAKKAAKSAGLYPTSTNESTSTWATTSMARSSSNLGQQPSSPVAAQGKGKAPAIARMGFNPIEEPTSTLNTEVSNGSGNKAIDEPQRHLEESRANFQSSQPITITEPGHSHSRQFSNASSVASSIIESPPGSFRDEPGFSTPSSLSVAGPQEHRSATPPNTQSPGLEPMLNFRSLAAMIGQEDKNLHEADHVENLADTSVGAQRSTDSSPARLKEPAASRSRGNSGESSRSGPPPIYEETDESVGQANGGAREEATTQKQQPDPASLNVQRDDGDQKDIIGNIHVVGESDREVSH